MSVAPPPKISTGSAPKPQPRALSAQLIEERIEEVRQALWWAEIVRASLRLVIGCLVFLLLWVVLDHWIYSPGRALRVIACLGLLSGAGYYIYHYLRPLLGSSIRSDYAARSLERDLPELRHALTSYVTLQEEQPRGDLRGRMLRSIGAFTATHLRGHDALPREATGTMRWWMAAVAALAILFAYAGFSPKDTLQSAARLAAPVAAIDPPRRVVIRDVQPGNTEAMAGRTIEISALIDGMRRSEQAVCAWELPEGRQELPLVDDSEARRHMAELTLPHSASGVVRYWIRAGDASAGPFHLSVQDVPVVALESVHYTPPKYTRQAPYTSRSGAITAVDGTTVRIQASVNRPVSKAKIEFNPRTLGDRIQATAGATEMEIDSEGTGLTVSFPLRSAVGRSSAVELENYRLLVWDAAGQGNLDPIVYPIRVVADLPPEVAIIVPASSPKEVPIDAQQIIEVHASDPDFGLKSISLEMRAGLDSIGEPVIWSSPEGEKGHRVAEFAFRPTALKLRIGDTVQVVAVAADNRSSELYPNIEANIVRTEPVTLKITAAGDIPDPNDPAADGLSSPDPTPPQEDQPPPEQQDKQPEETQPGESQAQEKQPGAESSQEQPSDPQDTQDAAQPGEQEQQQDQEKGADPAAQDTNDQSEAEGQADSDASAADERQTSDQPQDGAAGDPSDTGDPGQTPDQPTGDQPPTDQPAADQPAGDQPAGDQAAADPSSSPDQQTAAGEADSRKQEVDSGGDPQAESDSRDPSVGEPSGDGAGQISDSPPTPAEPKQPPKHDGEAFERIQEFLEKNRDRLPQPPPSQETPSAQDQDQPSHDPSTPPDQRDSDQRDSGERDRGEPGQPEPRTDESGRDPQPGETPDQQQQPSGQADDASGTQDDPRGDQPDPGQPDPGQPEPGQPEPGQADPGQAGSPERQDEGAEADAGEQPTEARPSDGPPSSDAAPTDSRDATDPSSAATTTSGGQMEAGDLGDAVDQADLPPDPANLEYTKKATDLVLDYLDQTRESPDPQLLEDLKWSREDLQRFVDRWREVRQLSEQSGAEGSREMEEALKSLGLRPTDDKATTTREAADELRGLRDSGPRRPPPAAYRDAFDAFRRAMGTQP